MERSKWLVNGTNGLGSCIVSQRKTLYSTNACLHPGAGMNNSKHFILRVTNKMHVVGGVGGGGWLRWTYIPSIEKEQHFSSCCLMQQEAELTTNKGPLCSIG